MVSSRLNLAYVVHSLNPGGTEKLVVEMSRAFAGEYDLLVLCLDEPGAWANELRGRGIPVHCVWRQPGLDLSVPVKLARHLRRHRTGIVHAHQCTPWFYAALARLLYPAPRLLLEEHGRFYPEVKHWPRALLNRLLIRRLTDRFVAVSEDVRRRLERYEGLDARRIEVIYNGVVAEPLLSPGARAALRSELGFSPEHFVVGTAGRFDPIKNLPLLIASLERAGREIGGLRGLLVGDGPQLADVRAQLKQRGLGDRVALTGFRDDARKLVQCLDLFVLASRSEGTSVALLEAMAAGVPVAVTAVGGNPEIVIDGQTGWVVPSESEEALTAAIRAAVIEPQARQGLARAGRRRFEERFGFERMLASYRAVYRSMCAENEKWLAVSG